MRIPRSPRRALKSAGAVAATCGVALGLMSGPAFAAPDESAAAAAAQKKEEVGAQSAWHVKQAKNVRRAPSKKLACAWVYGKGGSVTHGKACFQPKGDKFWIQEMKRDGLSITMRAMYAGNTQTIFDCRNYKGVNASWTACSFSKKMKEGRQIQFAPLAYKGTEMAAEGVTATEKS